MFHLAMNCRHKASRRRVAALAMAGWLGLCAHAVAQQGDCKLIPDERSKSEKILRCGDHLTIRNAARTKFEVNYPNGQSPNAIRLESGAVMIEFTPSDGQKSFQILTPHAIAAVRGTRWAVEVDAKRTSTLVLSGLVAVSHLTGEGTALLHAGEGADVSTSSGPIVVKRWGKKRVDALLARFGQ
jgi:ferric-dicitrate binding protein FerR (iron transport regulator)